MPTNSYAAVSGRLGQVPNPPPCLTVLAPNLPEPQHHTAVDNPICLEMLTKEWLPHLLTRQLRAWPKSDG